MLKLGPLTPKNVKICFIFPIINRVLLNFRRFETGSPKKKRSKLKKHGFGLIFNFNSGLPAACGRPFSARRQSSAAARGLRSRRSNKSGGYPKNVDDDYYKKDQGICGRSISFLVIFSQMSVLKHVLGEFESIQQSQTLGKEYT